MRLIAEELSRPTRLALLKVVGVLPGHVDAVLFDPVLQRREIPWHLFRQVRRLLQLLLQKASG